MTYVDHIADAALARLLPERPASVESFSTLRQTLCLARSSEMMDADLIAFRAARPPLGLDAATVTDQVYSLLDETFSGDHEACFRARDVARELAYRMDDAGPGSPEAEDLAIRLWAAAVVVGVLVDRIRSSGSEPGLLIALEGIDGSGKSTLLDRLATRMEGEADLPVATAKFPMSFDADGIAARGSMSEESLRLLFLSDLASGYRSCVKQSLEKGYITVVDRFWASSVVYASPETSGHVQQICETMLPSPDLTVLVQVPPRVAVQRLHERDGEAFDRGAGDSTEEALYHRQRTYRDLLRGYENEGDTRLLEVDGRLSTEDLVDDIVEAVKDLM